MVSIAGDDTGGSTGSAVRKIFFNSSPVCFKWERPLSQNPLCVTELFVGKLSALLPLKTGWPIVNPRA